MDKTLEQLALELYDAKDVENEAKAKRIEIEEQILDLVVCDDIGSVTVQAGKLKVNVRKGVSFSADIPAMMEEIKDVAGLPLVVKREFDDKAYLELEKYNPDMFRRVSQFVTSKPKKPAVTLKL